MTWNKFSRYSNGHTLDISVICINQINQVLIVISYLCDALMYRLILLEKFYPFFFFNINTKHFVEVDTVF